MTLVIEMKGRSFGMLRIVDGKRVEIWNGNKGEGSEYIVNL